MMFDTTTLKEAIDEIDQLVGEGFRKGVHQTFADGCQPDAMAIGGSRFRRRRGGHADVTTETVHSQLRFEIVAIRNLFIISHQLVGATIVQLRGDLEGKLHRTIGEILVE